MPHAYRDLLPQIDALLVRHTALWRSHSYALHCPAWLSHYPDLTQHLLSLSDTQVQHLQADDSALLNAVGDGFGDAGQILDLVQPFEWQGPPPSREEPPKGTPGRKWQQIRSFLSSNAAPLVNIPESLPAGTAAAPPHTVVEWCSGKAHLGRAIHEQTGAAVLGLEIDPSLVADATPQNTAPPIRIAGCDVLSEAVWQHLSPPPDWIVALHACGGLHQRLLTCASQRGCQHITLAPCCYHRYNAGYQPLSRTVQGSALRLTNQELRSAVRQSCTARAGEISQRRHRQARQLAFRLLLQDNGHDPAMPLPSLKGAEATDNLAALFQHYARAKCISAQPQRSTEEYSAMGKALLNRAERLELARMLFRRLLELRCVLDSALYLQEQGYQCEVKAFCDPAVSPRNLLITASKSRSGRG